MAKAPALSREEMQQLRQQKDPNCAPCCWAVTHATLMLLLCPIHTHVASVCGYDIICRQPPLLDLCYNPALQSARRVRTASRQRERSGDSRRASSKRSRGRGHAQMQQGLQQRVQPLQTMPYQWKQTRQHQSQVCGKSQKCTSTCLLLCVDAIAAVCSTMARLCCHRCGGGGASSSRARRCNSRSTSSGTARFSPGWRRGLVAARRAPADGFCPQHPPRHH